MSSYTNYKRDKYSNVKESNRTDINNPSFVNNIQVKESDKSTFDKNLNKWIFFIQWAKWFPDLFYDLITPEKGGMRLDLDQRMFLRCMSRFLVTYGVFPRGFGKCVSQDTMLFTTDGIKEIGEYFNYSKHLDEFYTTHNIELVNRYGLIEKSNKGVHSGLRPTKKIITEEGYEIEGTLVHPVLVMCKNGELKYKKLSEIEVGDYLPISRNNDIWGSKLSTEIYKEINLLDRTEIISEVPKSILQAPKEIVIKYIAKIFEKYNDFDNEVKLSSEKLSKQIQIILLNLGIICERSNTNGEFKIKLKKEEKRKLYKIINNPFSTNKNKYFYSKVKTIKDGKNFVCDLQMSDTHSFISNGFISHNTMLEIMSIYHTCIFFPDITIAMSAQTRENAASISEEKHKEIIKWFPLIKNEIVKSSFTKDSVEVIFTSGGTYSVLANSQSSKGQRRRRLNIEESALLNNELFKDALEPVVNVPRRTIGQRAEVNPYELNGMLNYITTSGYRGSDEFVRIINLLDEMAELKGKVVLGASWELPCHYGRGETKSQILAKKNDPTTSALSFAMNYESRWTGASDGALININKLLNAQTLKYPELSCPKDKNGNFELNEYVMGVDVARSSSQSNNKTAIVVLKILRNKEQRIRQVQLVNIETPPNGLTFEEQSLEVKKIFYRYGGNLDLNKSRVKAVVVDANNIGQGLVEKLLENIVDPDTDEEFDGWATINTEDKSKNPNAPEVLYSLKAQGINADIIRTFIDYVESNKLKLLSKYQNIDKNKNKIKKIDDMSLKVVCEQTSALIDEVANLKIKQTKSTSSTITVEQVSRKVDKDRYSALVYALYYINLFMDNDIVEDESTLLDYCYYL